MKNYTTTNEHYWWTTNNEIALSIRTDDEGHSIIFYTDCTTPTERLLELVPKAADYVNTTLTTIEQLYEEALSNEGYTSKAENIEVQVWF